MAVSMQYDIKAGAAPYSSVGGFPTVAHSGFPLVLSPNGTSQPMVAPPIPASGSNVSVATPGNLTLIGLSAGPSTPDPSDPTFQKQLVPVATAGIILAYIFVGQLQPNEQLTVGTLLSLAPTPTGNTWGLVPSSGSGAVVVAQLAIPLTNPSGTSVMVPAWVWVVPPNNIPSD
jgi:hypothetical protein